MNEGTGKAGKTAGTFAAILALCVLAGGASSTAASRTNAASPAATAAAKLNSPAYRRALKRRVARLNRLGSFEPRALKRFPGTFGGAWLDGQKLVLAFTEKPGGKASKLRRSFAKAKRVPPGRLEPRKVDDSLATLRDLLADLVADRGFFEHEYDAQVNLRGNNIVVTISDELDPGQFSLVREEMRDHFGTRAEDLAFERKPIAGQEAICKSVFNCNDLRAGLRSKLATAGSCTTAFVVTPPPGMPASHKAILSASHCGGSDVGAARKHGPNFFTYGHVFSDVYEGAVDAEVHSISEPGFSTDPSVRRHSVGPQPIIGKADLPVLAISNYKNLLVGTLVCRTGITSGWRCGKVLSKDYAPSIVPNSHSFIRADACAESGDSGGPWYQPFSFKPGIGGQTVHAAMATGVHGGGPKGYQCDDPGDWSYFSHITHVKKALGVKVKTPSDGEL